MGPIAGCRDEWRRQRDGIERRQPGIDSIRARKGAFRYGVLGGDKDRLSTCIVTVVRDRENDTPIAFNVLSLMPLQLHGESIDVMHLGLVLVDPGVRSKGLSWILYGLTCFLLYMRGGLRPIWISNVTQVPAVYGLVANGFPNTFPGLPNTRRSFEHTAIVRQIMAAHKDVYCVTPTAIGRRITQEVEQRRSSCRGCRLVCAGFSFLNGANDFYNAISDLKTLASSRDLAVDTYLDEQ